MFSGQAVLPRSSAFYKTSYTTSQTFVKIPVRCKSDIPLKVKASRQSGTVMDGEWWRGTSYTASVNWDRHSQRT